ncbi:glutathione S-transferase 1-1-like [Thrips palmi]|uniref:Glutathione S-transferase 1-1-like n=1 Tax=Thrips palmi TaxID=161013 RepID=A0A6P8Z1T5_THRPL|nr:glutathione S-transferase 1-1-like [Thrips palmi]
MGCMCAKSEPLSSASNGGLGIQNKVYDGPKPVLYYLSASPPCRSVLVTARQIGLDLDIRTVNILAGEHLAEDFVKLNPEHTIPTLDDGGFVLWESRAICTYLVTKYAARDDLYPKDEKKRAMVDRRLYFDATTLYGAIISLTKPIIMRVETQATEAKKKPVLDALQQLEKYLADSAWVAGDSLTVADTVIVASVASAQAIGVDLAQYPNIAGWFERCKTQLRGFQENAEGAAMYGQFVQSLLGAPAFP